MPEQHYLALNCGSSSLKFGVFSSSGERVELLMEGEAEEVGSDHATFWTRLGEAPKKEASESIPDHAAAFVRSKRALDEAGFVDLEGVGHRIVHGGPKLRNHVRLDDSVLSLLREAVPFAPLHVPASLSVIDAVTSNMSKIPQVICLDTAFHATMDDVARTIPLSKQVRDMGVQRFGFHGLSVESILGQLSHVPERMVVAHLGNGSSITALRNGKSADTTMGMTPSGGVMMGTRCGDIDPEILLYLLRQGKSTEDLEEAVNHEAGLKGVSERTSDVRDLMSARAADQRCDLALRMFAYQVRKAIGAMAAALGGLDLLVFTAGIGEHASALREEITGGLRCLGAFEIAVLPAQEDLQIVRITRKLLNG